MKPLSNYYKHKAMADGHLNKCKECVKARVGRHREVNLERIQEYDRNRPNAKERAKEGGERVKDILLEDGERAERRRRQVRESAERSPHKKAANAAVSSATRGVV